MYNSIITIPGVPIPQKRHRHRTLARSGSYPIVSHKDLQRKVFTTVYDPSATEKKAFEKHLLTQKPINIYSEAINVTIDFYMPRPLNHYGTGRNACVLKASAPLEHIKKPDLDNLAKFVLDCMNKIIITDDSIITGLTLFKWYSNEPRTVIRISKLEGTNEAMDH